MVLCSLVGKWIHHTQNKVFTALEASFFEALPRMMMKLRKNRGEVGAKQLGENQGE